LLNKFMRTNTAQDEDNLRVDQRLLAELKKLGIVETQYDLSRLCGKNPSYFSSMKTKGFGLKLGSLVLLSSRLRKRSSEISDPRVSMVFHHADQMVRQAIDDKCRLRELEIRYPPRKRKKPAPRKLVMGGTHP
jgi:hypothetical protein